MASFCGNCGSQVNDEAKFCPSCGHSVAPAQPKQAQPEQQYQQPPQQQYQQQYQQAPGYGQPYAPPVVPGAPGQADIRDAQENKTMAILAYILFFVPLITGAHKTSPFVRFHTNQGTVLFIAAIAWSIIYSILSVILIFLGAFGVLLITILGLCSFIFLVFCIIGIINAVNGAMKPLPLIGQINILK